jgi:GDP-L-fucose synthase
MSILVTGGSGLVGSAIKDVVNTTEHKNNYNWIFLSSKDGYLCDFDCTKQIFEKYKPVKYVIHLAAYVGGLYKNMREPVTFWQKNTKMNNNVLECCHLYNVKKCISCLSTCIFPDKTTFPIDETMIHNGPPHESNFAYAYSKRMIDVLNRAYSKQYNCCFTSIIPTNIYGPYDNFNLDDSHVIPGLIHKFYLQMNKNTDTNIDNDTKNDANSDNDIDNKSNDKEIVIYGSGKPLRQFIYNYDLAKLILWVIYNYNDSSPLILSVPEEDEVSIKDVVNIISDAFKYDGKITYDTSKSDGQYKKTACNKKLMTLMKNSSSNNNSFNFTDIKIGINQTVKWFIENYESSRH